MQQLFKSYLITLSNIVLLVKLVRRYSDIYLSELAPFSQTIRTGRRASRQGERLLGAAGRSALVRQETEDGHQKLGRKDRQFG